MVDKKLKEEKIAFQQDVKKLFEGYGIKGGNFILLCTSCGSPDVHIHLWNPTAFTRVCQECGYKELYEIQQAGTNLTDLQRKGLI